MRGLIVVLFLFFYSYAKAQEKLGIANSNYSSTNGIYLSPTASVDSKTYMQLNLIGANAFFYNNIAYLPWFSVWRLKRHPGEIENPKISNVATKKFVYTNAALDGLSFVISKRKYGAGIFVRARTIAEVKRVPFEVSRLFLKNDSYNDFKTEDDINLQNVRGSNMSWVEYGLNFGYILKQDQKNMLTLAANLKYLTGINIFYANITRVKGYYNDSLVKLDEISGKLRYNQPSWNSGIGVSADFGITYKKMLKNVENYYPNSTLSNCTNIGYKYKATVSLRDLGYLRFTEGTTKANLNTSGEFNKNVDTTQEIIQNRLNLTINSAAILASLPTNLTAQFDWNLENHIYINATIIKNLVLNRLTGVQSINLISVCPRVEFKQFEVAMPLTLQKFIYPQLGFAFRVRSFVLGFDNVFPLMFMKPKTYGLGVYFNLGISIFKNPACKKSQRAVFCPPNKMGNTRSSSKKSKWLFWKKS